MSVTTYRGIVRSGKVEPVTPLELLPNRSY